MKWIDAKKERPPSDQVFMGYFKPGRFDVVLEGLSIDDDEPCYEGAYGCCNNSYSKDLLVKWLSIDELNKSLNE